MNRLDLVSQLKIVRGFQAHVLVRFKNVYPANHFFNVSLQAFNAAEIPERPGRRPGGL